MSSGGSARKSYSSSIADATEYTDWILALFATSIRGTIAEVGIGHGSYARRLAGTAGYTGLDIDPEAVADARRRFPAGRFMTADIARRDMIEPIGLGSFDTVLCFNVLEHLRPDRAAAANLLDLLRPGGRLLLFVPAFQRLYGDLDRLAGHERRYDKAMVRALFDGLPARLRRAEYVNPVGGIGWWLNSRVRHDDLDGAAVNAQIRFFTRFILPVSRALTPLTKNVFGQSMVVEAERS
jgi:SAM-dependent methyltransferase